MCRLAWLITYALDHVGAVCLERVLDRRDLRLVRVLVTVDIDGGPNLHVHFGVLDRLHDECGVVAVGSVQSDPGSKLRQ